MKMIYVLVFTLMTGSGVTRILASPEASPVVLGPPVDELRNKIEQIIERTRTPGAAVAVVGADGIVWQGTFGLANIAAKVPVGSHTIFRLGSISKMFIALGVMQLVEEGKLTLNSRLATLAPEIAFDNPWEQTDPIRLVQLLEHTTGWDAPHAVENAQNHKKPISPEEALAFHPSSRVSRWVPGSRSAYNNSGPTLAAYIVEKTAALPYEDYIKQILLDPLGMTDTDFFCTDQYRKNAATLYRRGRVQPYWHLNNRAAGGMNSSLADMAIFARFLLNRGRFKGQQILSADSVAATETPRGSLAAQAGQEISFGLGNSVFHYNGYLYHGHQGALFGAEALIAYQPELAIAHVILLNSNSRALTEIHTLLSEYETAGKEIPVVTPLLKANLAQQALSGFYRPINPLSSQLPFLQIFSVSKLAIAPDKAFIKPLLGGATRTLLPGNGTSMLQADTQKVVLVSGDDPLAGKVIYYGPQTLKKISAIGAYGPFILIALWVVLSVSALVFALVWLPRRALDRLESGPQLRVRFWPLVSALSVVAFGFTLLRINQSVFPYAQLGAVTAASLTLMLATIVFAASTGWSVYVLFVSRKAQMNRLLRWHSIVLTCLNVFMSIYLASYGLIGVRTWL